MYLLPYYLLFHTYGFSTIFISNQYEKHFKLYDEHIAEELKFY